jgi:hypothetical protein
MARKKEPIQHGTTGGYMTHKRRTDVVCDECRIAWREYYRRHRAIRELREVAIEIERDNEAN